LDKGIFIKRSVVESILSYARGLHPRESVLLLKGKADKQGLTINEVQIPPFATHGRTFSGFPIYTLPIDFSFIGVAHSHPSGALRPSNVDLNRFYGRIMLITAYPYLSEKNMALFNREGKQLKYSVV
jgi:proteasome lid subunit RPN8/RPN11